MNLASKVIIDTHGEDPRSAFNELARWRARGRVVADLEWTRLTRWREPIAHIFDNAARENKLSNFHTIEVAHADDKPCASVLYMAAWLSAPYKAKVSILKTEGSGSGLHRVTLRSGSETIDFERTSRDCMTLRSTNGRERKYSFSEASLYTLMNEELSLLGPDPAFDSAFTHAQELAGDR